MVELFCLKNPVIANCPVRMFAFHEKWLSFADYSFSELISQLVIQKKKNWLTFLDSFGNLWADAGHWLPQGGLQCPALPLLTG